MVLEAETIPQEQVGQPQPELSYQELLFLASNELKSNGRFDTELTADQAKALVADTIAEASGKLPGFVSLQVDNLQVGIADQTASVDTSLQTSAGPFLKNNFQGSLVLENEPEDETQLRLASFSVEPPTVKIPKIARPKVRRFASEVAGYDVGSLETLDIAAMLQMGLDNNHGINGAFQTAIDRELLPNGATVSRVSLHITERNTLQVGMEGGVRPIPTTPRRG